MSASLTSIRVAVRLFASYREALGQRQLELTLSSGARVADLIDTLAPKIPALKSAPGMVAVNQSYVTPETALNDGDEVALIPPVSGG